VGAGVETVSQAGSGSGHHDDDPAFGSRNRSAIDSMKIYTRQGDDGKTGLFGGSRVPKSDARIDCIGAVDELNAALGWCAVVADPALRDKVLCVQNELFVVGGHLSTPQGVTPSPTLPALEEQRIARLEQEIDAAEALLVPLRQFILPGGIESAARLHVCRAVCRRAERLLVALAQEQVIAPFVVTYINRLSDWLFVQARLANQLAGVADVPWQK
jgi:cob(I)alamin adenosyltransferase